MNKDILDALNNYNIQLRNIYGDSASLEIFQRNGKERFRFVNVKPIRNYPSYGFKTPDSAMRALKMHESGYVSKRIKQRKQKQNVTVDIDYSI